MPALELFLSQRRMFYHYCQERPLITTCLTTSSLQCLENDRSVIIKLADKGSTMVVWDRNYYLKEAERKLNNEKTCEEIRIT